MVNLKGAEKILSACSQMHVLKYYDALDKDERKSLLAQISKIDPAEVNRCASMLKGKQKSRLLKVGLAPKVALLKGKARQNAVETGEKELKSGRVAALLVAGGQGSRLGYEGPKGSFPIGPVSNKPIFYFHARKILAQEIKYNTTIPLYVMTSEANDALTRKCFSDNSYFGLNKKNVFFFKQGMWPGFDESGKIILDEKHHVFMSPDGHGGLLDALKKSGALLDMKRRGVKHIFFFQVDNPLVEIADSAFIGYHVLQKSEYSLKLCEKSNPYEKVGVPMKFGKKHMMVEYSEMSKKDCEKRVNGVLYYRYGSPAIHVFDRGFLEREADKDMPLHLAFKKIPLIDEKGQKVVPSEPNGYKFEKFIFDLMPNAKKVAFMAFDTKEEFSPVKNASGEDSPSSCKRDMMNKWRRQLESRGIQISEESVFEVDEATLIIGGK